MQNLIATKLGVQRITGISLYDKREKKAYDPLPDLEVGNLYSQKKLFWIFLFQSIQIRMHEQSNS